MSRLVILWVSCHYLWLFPFLILRLDQSTNSQRNPWTVEGETLTCRVKSTFQLQKSEQEERTVTVPGHQAERAPPRLSALGKSTRLEGGLRMLSQAAVGPSVTSVLCWQAAMFWINAATVLWTLGTSPRHPHKQQMQLRSRDKMLPNCLETAINDPIVSLYSPVRSKKKCTQNQKSNKRERKSKTTVNSHNSYYTTFNDWGWGELDVLAFSTDEWQCEHHIQCLYIEHCLWTWTKYSQLLHCTFSITSILSLLFMREKSSS